MSKTLEAGAGISQDTPLPELKRISPAVVGAARDEHVLVGQITSAGEDSYEAKLMLPPAINRTYPVPYRDHVKATTMMDATHQVVIGGRRLGGEAHRAYRILSSTESFHKILTPGDEAEVHVSFRKRKDVEAHPIYELKAHIVDSSGDKVMESKSLCTIIDLQKRKPQRIHGTQPPDSEKSSWSLVGMAKDEHVLIGNITGSEENGFEAPLILPPAAEHSYPAPYADHVKATTMMDATHQVFIGARRRGGETRRSYRILSSKERFHRILNPADNARVHITYRKRKDVEAGPVYEVNSTMVDSSGQKVMESRTHFVITEPPRKPRQKQ
jgi:hypothetical protein